jgi:hypothetical protein
MPTAGCSKANLLNEFRDNNVQAITAESMRLFVNCVYDNFTPIESIVDNLSSYVSNQPLSANQGARLNDRVGVTENDINDLQSDKANKTDVYNKIESDNRYYTQTYVDDNLYTVNELYTRAEIDNAISTIQQAIMQLNDRIDNIVNLNDLIE